MEPAGVFLAERPNHVVVEGLVDGEMAEAARRDDSDTQIFWIAFDRFPDGLVELVAAARRRLVGPVPNLHRKEQRENAHRPDCDERG